MTHPCLSPLMKRPLYTGVLVLDQSSLACLWIFYRDATSHFCGRSVKWAGAAGNDAPITLRMRMSVANRCARGGTRRLPQQRPRGSKSGRSRMAKFLTNVCFTLYCGLPQQKHTEPTREVTWLSTRGPTLIPTGADTLAKQN